MADDLASLPELEDKTLLEAIQVRYKQEKIYTYIGDILIAVNPYKTVPLYGQEKWTQYTDVRVCSELPPHLYAISDSAYQNMRRNALDQCCVVSGESGAGKTESTKLMIQHIVQLCRHDSSDLHHKIIQVNPLLEAFGNAQTVINDNSSRFGKFIELNFDMNGQILGASINEYLLEKSRVVSHSEGERTFHIFYYLFAGLDKETKDSNLLKLPEEHRILKQFPDEKIYQDKTDLETCKGRWKELLDIMTSVGFLELEVDGILAILAAILHIANVKFISDPSTDGVLIKNEETLSIIAQLLDVRPEALVKALISNTASAGIEKITSLKNESQANDGRDALAKALYGQLFSWIVSKINQLLQPKIKKSETPKPGLTIGILDIYGFENFKNNSFEQLCINVANEQLQYFFNLHIFKLELEEYEREGVQGNNVTFIDNRPLLDLFLEKLGVFDILDEESKFPAATEQTFIDKLSRNLSKKPEFKTPKGQTLEFMIQHFAGLVTYNVNGFLEKNRDTLSDGIMQCLTKSTSILVVEIFDLLPKISGTTKGGTCRNLRMSVLQKGPLKAQPVSSRAVMTGINPLGTIRGMPGSGGDGFPKITKTLASQFKNSLDSLLLKLLAAQPHFIRCLKPNGAKQPSNFEPKIVLEQLSYTGVLETVKIRKQGYSSRLVFSEFVQRYGLISSVVSLKKNDDGAKICRGVLEKSSLKEWQVGKTKVFLKYWHLEKLNAMLTEASKKVVSCQKFWRSALAERQLRRLRQAAKEYAQQMQTMCTDLTKMAEKLFAVQQHLHEQDKENQKKKEKQELEESKRKLQEKKEKEISAALLKTSAGGTISAKSVKNSGMTSPSSNLSTIHEVPAPPATPEAFNAGRTMTINTSTQILLLETVPKLAQLSTDIWAKVYYMEKNAIVGKVYLRDWEVLMDDSVTEYNGVVIGVNSQAFEHINDPDSAAVVKSIGKGVKIARDDDGNIYLTKLSSSDIIIRGHSDPEKYCFSKEISDTEGKLKHDQLKVFDMSVFKDRIARELQKSDIDAYGLARLCVIGFSFHKDVPRDVDTPCWVCVINFIALDLLGKPEVVDELKKNKKIPSNIDTKDLLKRWAALDFKRREDGFGGSSVRNSARM